MRPGWCYKCGEQLLSPRLYVCTRCRELDTGEQPGVPVPVGPREPELVGAAEIDARRAMEVGVGVAESAEGGRTC